MRKKILPETFSGKVSASVSGDSVFFPDIFRRVLVSFGAGLNLLSGHCP